MSAADVATAVVEAIVVHPGDTLVISLPETLDQKQFTEYVELLGARFDDGIKLVMLGGAIGIYVLRPGEVAE